MDNLGHEAVGWMALAYAKSEQAISGRVSGSSLSMRKAVVALGRFATEMGVPVDEIVEQIVVGEAEREAEFINRTGLKPGYYYEHTNGNIIFKNAAVVDADPQYFDSPFVKKVWHLEDPLNAPLVLQEKWEAQNDSSRDGS